MLPPNLSRFEDYFIPEPTSGCWIWLLCLNTGGYAQLTRSIDGHKHCFRAHRVAWELYKGAIPNGLVIDHKCRMRCCVNPNHMELVTQRENVLRGEGFPARYHKQTHCINGHPLEGNNVYWYRGYRMCIPCSRARDKMRRRKNGIRETETATIY